MKNLPKKIQETIKREFVTENYTTLKRVTIHEKIKHLDVDFVVLIIGLQNKLTLLRYWGDDSYGFSTGFMNTQEAYEELKHQIDSLL